MRNVKNRRRRVFEAVRPRLDGYDAQPAVRLGLSSKLFPVFLNGLGVSLVADKRKNGLPFPVSQPGVQKLLARDLPAVDPGRFDSARELDSLEPGFTTNASVS